MNFRIEILHEINDVFDDNVDVYVILPNNEKYVATFFTLKNIATIMSGIGNLANHHQVPIFGLQI